MPVARNGASAGGGEKGRGGEKRGQASLWAGRPRPPIGRGASARGPIRQKGGGGGGRCRGDVTRVVTARARGRAGWVGGGGRGALRGVSAGPLSSRRHFGWRVWFVCGGFFPGREEERPCPPYARRFVRRNERRQRPVLRPTRLCVRSPQGTGGIASPRAAVMPA